MSLRRRSALAATATALTLALVAGACGGSGHRATTTTVPSSTTAAPTGTALAGLHLTTTTVATLDAPIAMAIRSGTDDLYVAEKAGKVRRIAVTTAGDGTRRFELVGPAVLDLSKQVVSDGERGLLGLAFSSDGSHLYVFATLAPDGTSSVASYAMHGTTADPASRRELLSIPRKYPNHNGGELAFGPDGYLYIGIGDGGSEGDPDHHGQDTTTLFSKILRIDPEGGTGSGTGAGHAYGIPAGNPFERGGGRPEIWLSGVRNPWRFSFDRADGDLWIGDVGQDAWEEIDHLPATAGRGAGQGANLGWSRMEGTHPYKGGTNPPGGVLPVDEYSHADGCSITGGYVYRGPAIPALQGAYLYADYCEAGLRAIVVHGSRVTDARTFALPLAQVQSFGEDDAGEVYALLASGPVLQIDSRT